MVGKRVIVVSFCMAACSSGALKVGSDANGSLDGGDVDAGVAGHGGNGDSGVGDGAPGDASAGDGPLVPPDAACAPESVWRAADDGFSYMIFDTPIVPPFPTCGALGRTYTFTTGSKVLHLHECSVDAGATDRDVPLTDTQANELVLIVAPLTTVCPAESCFTDSGGQTLTVTSAGASRSYEGLKVVCFAPGRQFVNLRALDEALRSWVGG